MSAEPRRVVRIGWVIAGVVAATVLGSLIMTFAVCAASDNVNVVTFADAVNQYITLLGGVMFFGLLFALPIFLLVILPIFVVGNRLGAMTPVVLICVGAAIPGALMLIGRATRLGAIFWFYDRHGVVSLACALACGALGGAVSCLGLTERRG
jgi:predicted ABC-type exoprotein transport system permease subunit